LPNFRQQQGQICEHILTEWLLRRGYYVLRPLAGQGPIDVMAYDEEGTIFFFDAKQNSMRINPGRKNKTRIHRPLSETQKRLGVRVAYVDIENRDVHIVPSIDD
jgi:hypothetical protein